MSTIELKGLKNLRNLDSKISKSSVSSSSIDNIQCLSVDILIPGKYQPRKQVNEQALIELAESIRAQGIIQPLIVRKVQSDKYEIIAGERRWRGAKIAGLVDVPAIVREINDNVAFAFALIENIQREDLNPVEEASAFVRFRDEFSMTHDQIAQMVGRSRTSITNALRLLTLGPEVRTLLEEGRLDMGHARALLTLDPERQLKVALTIVNKQLNVREAEKLVNSTKATDSTKNAKESPIYRDKCEVWSRQLTQKFSTKVSVKLNERGTGKVIIQVDSPDEVDWLIDHVKID